MKQIMIRWGLICAILVAIAQTASGQCSSKTIQGTYGYIIELADLSGVPGVQLGTITYDGTGHHSGVGWLTYGWFGVLPLGQLVGEQTVYPDCRFVGKHFDEQGNIGATFEGTITGSGVFQELHFVVTYVEPQVVAYGTAYKISSKTCSLSTLEGAYTFSGRGTVYYPNTPPSPPTPALAVREGIVDFDGTGNFSGRARVITSLSAPTVPPETSDNFPDTFAGTYTVDTDCMASLTITSSTSSVFFPPITEMGAITRDKQFQGVDVMITNENFAFAERIRKQ